MTKWPLFVVVVVVVLRGQIEVIFVQSLKALSLKATEKTPNVTVCDKARNPDN